MSYILLYWPRRGFTQRTTSAIRGAISFPCIPKLRTASAFLYLVICQTGLSQAFDDRLHRAAWEGDLGALESLLNEGASASARDKDDRTPLHYAKTASVAEKLLEAGADIWALDSGDNTPLHFALTEGVVDELIKAWRANSLSADPEWDYPNWQNAFGRTPLHTAKTADVARALLRAGSNIFALDFRRNTPLHYANTEGVVDELMTVWRTNSSDDDYANKENSLGRTPLHLAAQAGYSDVVMKLLNETRADSMPSYERRDRGGATPLHYAKTEGVLDVLIAAGGDPRALDHNHATPLHYARNVDVAERLLREGVDIDAADKRRETPLHYAIQAGLSDVVTVLLQNNANPLGTPTGSGSRCPECDSVNSKSDLSTLLLESAKWPRTCAEIDASLRRTTISNVDPDMYATSDPSEAILAFHSVLWLFDSAIWDGRFKECEGWTPLHYAARSGNSVIVRSLLERLEQTGEETEAVALRNLYGDTPLLSYVASRGIVTQLLRHVADREAALNSRNIFGDTLLHRVTSSQAVRYLLREITQRNMAARARNVFAVTPLHDVREEGAAEALLAAGAEVDAKDIWGNTPLHYAARNGREGVLQKLLELRPDTKVDESNWRDETPLFLAAGTGKIGMVQSLLSARANPTARDERGSTPLHQAAREGVAGMVQLLLSLGGQGVEPNVEDRFGYTPLHVASSEGVVRVLLQHGADPLAETTADHATPLHFVTTPGAARALLRAGANANARTRDNDTPLHFAVLRGDVRVVLQLLNGGADAKAKGDNGATPLHRADAPDVVKALIASRAAVDAIDDNGATPLHRVNEPDAVKELILAGADPNKVDDNKETPLHYAVKSGNSRVVKELLKTIQDRDETAKSIFVNAQDKFGKTPLHHAAESKFAGLEVVGLLVGNSADLDAVTEEGDSPLDLFESLDRPDADEIEECLKTGACAQTISSNPSSPSNENSVSSPLGAGEDINSIGMVFVKIPAGVFLMGTEVGGFDDERPVTEVAIETAFEMGKHEVTQEQWISVMGESQGRVFDCATCPVNTVNWSDALKFVEALNEMENDATYRLPTEAEWEYAARAGNSGDRHGELDNIAWYEKNSQGKPHPVGEKQSNDFGLHDMIGNVWEWVQVEYRTYPGGSVSTEAGSASGWAERGGGYASPDLECRSANRSFEFADMIEGFEGLRSHRTGFRIVRTVR